MTRNWKQLYLVLVLFTVVCFSAEGANTAEPALTLSCKDADIRDVLRGIAMQYSINIVPDSNVMGNVTVYLQDVPFETGLSTLLESYGFGYEKREGMYFVYLKDSAAKSLEVSFQDGRLTLDVENADIGQLLREISRQTGLNIVAESGLTGEVTATLSDVLAEEALYSLLTANGFTVDEDDGIYRVRGGGIRQQRGIGTLSILYRNGKLSIDVKNAPAVDVLSEIAQQSKINLITVGNIQGTVTMRLDDVTLEQALDAMTDAAGIAYTMMNNIYLVGDPTVRPGQLNPLLERKVVWLKHIDAQDLQNALPSDIPRTSVTISQDRNALILLGSRKVIQQIESIINEIDIENPEIRSRQEMAISVEVDDEGLLTIDAKDSPMVMLLREISIRKGIDMTILEYPGAETWLTSQVSSRVQQERPTASAPQVPASPRQRVIAPRSSGIASEFVNFRISKASLEDTFSALFKGTPYAYKKELKGNREFYIIGTGELLLGGGNPLVISEKITLKYLKAADIINYLPINIPEANIITMEDQNAVVIMGTQSMVDEVKNYITQIDSPVPQIMIEALLIELTKGNSRDLGVNWSWSRGKNAIDIAPGLSATFDSLADVPESFFAALNALVSENKARILANPRVATMNGQKATMNVGWTDYFETTTEIYKGTDVPVGGYTRRGFNVLESGITLDITPWVGAAGEITVLVHPDIRDAKEISKEHSTIANRTLETQVRVKDGETIVIGGLIQKNEAARESKIPILGSIPILGHLFKESHKEQSDTELIIIVKPKIINGSREG